MLQQTFDHSYDSALRTHENKLFFKQWIRHPGRLGTVAPISVRLARAAAAKVLHSSDAGSSDAGYVVEIGAGTGRLTRALLEHGVSASKLAVVELDSTLCIFLQDTLPAVCPTSGAPLVIEGDAANLPDLVPPSWVGNVETVVSVVPLMYFSEEKRIAIIEAAFRILKPGGHIIHVTYNLKSPLAFSRAYTQERMVGLWLNLPPGFVWLYTKKEIAQTCVVDCPDAALRKSG